MANRCRPRSDCSCRSSLIWVYTVCLGRSAKYLGVLWYFSHYCFFGEIIVFNWIIHLWLVLLTGSVTPCCFYVIGDFFHTFYFWCLFILFFFFFFRLLLCASLFFSDFFSCLLLILFFFFSFFFFVGYLFFFIFWSCCFSLLFLLLISFWLLFLFYLFIVFISIILFIYIFLSKLVGEFIRKAKQKTSKVQFVLLYLKKHFFLCLIV